VERSVLRLSLAAACLALVAGSIVVSFWVATKNFEIANFEKTPKAREVLASIEGDEARTMAARWFASESNRALFGLLNPLQVAGVAAAALLGLRALRGRAHEKLARRFCCPRLAVALSPWFRDDRERARARLRDARAGGPRRSCAIHDVARDLQRGRPAAAPRRARADPPALPCGVLAANRSPTLTPPASNDELVPAAPEFSAKANVPTFERYRQLYADSVASPEAFWAKQAERLVWTEKWKKVLEWDFTTAGEVVRGRQAQRLLQLRRPPRRGGRQPGRDPVRRRPSASARVTYRELKRR
jgi:hypothetical protein